jgi:hypothetical protein
MPCVGGTGSPEEVVREIIVPPRGLISRAVRARFEDARAASRTPNTAGIIVQGYDGFVAMSDPPPIPDCDGSIKIE